MVTRGQSGPRDPAALRGHAPGAKVRKKTLLSWSSGKDSAWALHLLRQDPTVKVVGLLTVLNEQYNRVSMHATRAELLRQQAESADLTLHQINLPSPCTNEQYTTRMAACMAEFATNGIDYMAFGDLFLADIRQYREARMQGTGITPLFPLWQIPTNKLAEQMLCAGLEAYISSVDLAKLPASFAGRRWSRELLEELPAGIDPCGENGEMHTIVVGGPMLRQRIDIEVGEILQRDGFAYADIIPVR